MAVVYTIAMRNSRLALVQAAIDGGGANGVLRLLAGGGSVLSTLPLARPCGTIANAVLTFQGMSLIDPSATGGAIAVAGSISDSNGNTVVSGLTVGGSTSFDIVITPTNFIAPGQAVAITQASITGN